MTNGPEDEMQRLQRLSALADGELDADESALACGHWRGDAAVRARWHAYQLIGDVMRSEELASDAARDARFVRSLSERLAAEPVVLAPQPAGPSSPVAGSDARRSRWTWMAPAAVAAGFMAVASVLVVTGGAGPSPVPGADARLMSQAGNRGAAVMPGNGFLPGGTGPGFETPTVFASDQIVRDARLDRYFAAHTQFGGSSALGLPSGFLRASTTQAPPR